MDKTTEERDEDNIILAQKILVKMHRIEKQMQYIYVAMYILIAIVFGTMVYLFIK